MLTFLEVTLPSRIRAAVLSPVAPLCCLVAVAVIAAAILAL